MASASNHLSNQQSKTTAAVTPALNPESLALDALLQQSFERTTAADKHPSADDSDDVETYVQTCSRRAQELEGLRAFEALLVRVRDSALVQAKAAEKRPARVDWLSRFLSTPQRIQTAGVSLCSMLCGVLTMSRAQVSSNSAPPPDGLLRAVMAFSGSSHMGLLVGGILVAAGAVGFLCSVFKNSHSAVAGSQDSSPQQGRS
jgi:hypothetical protein